MVFGLDDLIAGGISAGAGLVSGALSGNSNEQQTLILQQMNQEIEELKKTYPPEEAQRIALERYKQAGVLTPEMEATITQGPSRMEQISVAPGLKEAQLAALAKLQQVGTEGMTLEQRAAQDQLLREVARQEQSRQQGIIQGMQQRGISGAGAEAALQAGSSQAAADRASQQAMQTAASARANALQAIMQGGQLGGQMREQEFGEKTKVASAADAIAKMNAANKQAVEGANVGARNLAQRYNLDVAQDVANRNVATSQREEQYNKELARQKYLDMLATQKSKMDAQSNLAKAAADEAARGRKSTSDIVSGIGKAATGVAQYGADQGWFKSSPSTSTDSTEEDNTVYGKKGKQEEENF